ncbi:MAG: PepSY-associated TM helix domain-containing protein [Nitrosomonas sp.]|uniref:PepSY-associated TM helix domain-containing protein n=1 Tax=Nitrosomonas sp. TaxID=42353 RepID=UPI0027256BA1|nr:PepSY-associated TM helix domain-containing protein [Nitrosomonas sp.]MDO9469695.1 PepSY-associated TM helix domain-containing protein [Nitrosomonas sp.]MDP1786268.1 PepSY-associated TM helix domain-containing protein [Nitrosomonas sp.]MDP2224440.1 PepSY-associated TM helix domain-containing protein [Nitrosomonas sp.]
MKKFIESAIPTEIQQQEKQSGKSRVSRQILTLLHRWAGLFLAVFLFISGLTGAIISWDHELDEWLNPQLFERQSQGEPLPSLALADQFEASNPKILITWLPLSIEPDQNLGLNVIGRIDPTTGKAFDLGFNQIALDPVNGEIRGSRMWGKISLNREDLLSFLYKLHFSMHIPDAFDIELGIVFMGILAIVWSIDCFIALWISFPNFQTWRKSFAFRWQQGGYKLNFDLHRSGGVWLWGLLLILAVTAVSMNLKLEITRPIVAIFSELTPDPFALRTPNPHDEPIEPGIGRREIIRLANAEAQRRNWHTPLGGMFYEPEYGIYGVTFHEPGHDHAEFGLGNPWLYFDGQDGAYLGDRIPGSGSAGDIFLDAQFPLHSGRILGLPGRIMISLLGLLVATLSVTGVIIWQRKRLARTKVANAL